MAKGKDRRPVRGRQGWGWYGDGHDWMPEDHGLPEMISQAVFDRLPGGRPDLYSRWYDTEKEAADALRQAEGG